MLIFVEVLGEIDLRHHVGGNRRHMLVAVDQAGASSLSRRCNQGVNEGEPLLQSATNSECGESHLFIDGYDLVQQLQVVLHRAVCLIDCGSELAQSPAEFGERNTASEDFGVILLEQCLDPWPTRLLTAMGDQGRRVEQVT